MDKKALTTLRESLENARQQLDYVIGRLREGEETRYMRWRCTRCEYIKHFTRPMPAHAAPPCPQMPWSFAPHRHLSVMLSAPETSLTL